MESLDDLEELRKEAQEADEEPDPADDPLLTETGHILLDYIGLSRQVALVERTPDNDGTSIQ